MAAQRGARHQWETREGLGNQKGLWALQDMGKFLSIDGRVVVKGWGEERSSKRRLKCIDKRQQ